MSKRSIPDDWGFLFDNSADGILLMDESGAILDANPRACDLLGYDRQELLKLSTAAIVAPEELGAHRARLHAVIDEEVAPQERRLRHRDGTVFTVEGWGRVLADGRIMGFMRDVEHRRLTEAARSSEALNGAMLEAAIDAIISMDHEGRVIEFNPAAERLFGHRRANVIGRPMADLIVPERLRAAHTQGLARYLAGGAPKVLGRRLELPAIRADGTEITVELSICQLTLSGPPRFVGFARDVSDRRRAEEALRRNEQLFRALIEAATDMVSIVGSDGRLRYQSPSVERVLGHEPAAMIGQDPLDYVHPDDRALAVAAFTEIREVGESRPIEVRMRRIDGTWRVIQGAGTNRLDDPDIQGIVVNSRDVTDRRRAEEALLHSENQLRHAQRLESVGRLAGGVAHDFNNLLTVILAYSDQQIARLGTDHPLHRAATEIHKAAIRAAALTRQLLAFSRRQVLEPRVLDLDAVLSDLGPMLKRLIGEHIDLLIHPGAQQGRVRADRGQIEQVIMNLVVNARDAMPNGGRLSIGTDAVMLDAAQAARLEGLAPGRYLALAVSDSGSGMDADVRAKLFEPFFTTKERGEGTGLGLSTVYGIVQQSGGAIDVDSEPDQGATFTIYLPCVDAAVVDVPAPAVGDVEGFGNETVLLAEDEDVVRSLMSELLQGAGYHVLEARSGRAALEVAEAFADPIHLLLTDVVMPGMSGGELAEHVTAARPTTRVLFVSGYTRDLIAQQGILEAGVHLLQKPFAPDVLIRKVREVLDAPHQRVA